MNGMLDFGGDVYYYPDFAYNNTYGQFLTEDVYLAAKQSYKQKGGCQDLAATCHAAADAGDPLGRGTNETVNDLCRSATRNCADNFLIFGRFNNVSLLTNGLFDTDQTLLCRYPPSISQ
jgi:hypothetical protein